MTVVAIVQARMGSSRLPGKVMADLLGRPLLARVLERAQAIRSVDSVILATTRAARDRVLLELAKECDVIPFAGSEDDVLDRYYAAARAVSADIIIRLTADCPLLDPEVTGQVLERFLQGDVDYASNNHPPTFPDGLDSEVFSFLALEEAWRRARLTSEREHVTPYIWKNPAKFRLSNIASPIDLSAMRWTVDEPADLEFVRAVYAGLCRNNQVPFHVADVLALLAREPALGKLNQGLVRDEGYAKSLLDDQVIE